MAERMGGRYGPPSIALGFGLFAAVSPGLFGSSYQVTMPMKVQGRHCTLHKLAFPVVSHAVVDLMESENDVEISS